MGHWITRNSREDDWDRNQASYLHFHDLLVLFLTCHVPVSMTQHLIWFTTSKRVLNLVSHDPKVSGKTFLRRIRALEEKPCSHLGSWEPPQHRWAPNVPCKHPIWSSRSKLTLKITSYTYIMNFRLGDTGHRPCHVRLLTLLYLQQIAMQMQALEDVVDRTAPNLPLQLLSIYQ